MEKLVPDVRKGPANSRWFTTPTSTIEMRFSESTPRPLQISPSETVRQNGWLILKLPRALKRIQFWIIISHKQWKTMNARSGLRRIQAEIFPSAAGVEKIWVIFWVLDQRTDYVNRSSRRLCQINCRVKDENDKREASASRTAPINFMHQTVWLTATDSLTRAVGNPKA